MTTINSDRAVTTINIQSISGATTVNGDGQDVINVGSEAPQSGGDVVGISAPLAIVGANGMDIVNVDATGSTLQENATLTSSSLTGLEMPDGITYSNLAALDVSLGGGGNNVTYSAPVPAARKSMPAQAPTRSTSRPPWATCSSPAARAATRSSWAAHRPPRRGRPSRSTAP